MDDNTKVFSLPLEIGPGDLLSHRCVMLPIFPNDEQGEFIIGIQKEYPDYSIFRCIKDSVVFPVLSEDKSFAISQKWANKPDNLPEHETITVTPKPTSVPGLLLDINHEYKLMVYKLTQP